MFGAPVFLTLLVLSCGYGLWRGDRDVRIVAAACMLATLATHFAIAPLRERYASVEEGLMVIDGLMLLVFVTVALRSDRFWPLWVAGLALGFGLAHHRTIILMIPGALAFWGLEARGWGLVGRRLPASSLKSQASRAVVAALAGCLLYAYLPLRAPQWIDSPRAFAEYVAGSSALSVWLATDAANVAARRSCVVHRAILPGAPRAPRAPRASRASERSRTSAG